MGGCLYRHWMLNPSTRKWVNGVDLAVDRTSQVTGHAQPSVITTRIVSYNHTVIILTRCRVSIGALWLCSAMCTS